MTDHDQPPSSRLQRPPPEVWSKGRDAARKAFSPVDRFLHVEASSGILLLLATAAALVLANSNGNAFYERLWHTPLRLGIGSWTFERPLHFWINDGLMVIFFFVVGLEVRREIHEGELAELRRASLPLAAALGGMIVPALIFFSLNRGTPTQRGWGVPMATDIAFGVGVLALMGRRVPASVRVLLLALAVIDDIGAILVIAVFYAVGFSWWGIGIASLGVVLVVALRGIGVRSPAAYVVPAVVMWIGCLRAGVHPTIAGVVLGLLTPVRAWYGERDFLATASSALTRFNARIERTHDQRDLVTPLLDLGEARREVVSPGVRLERFLHPWVSFGILPLFAFANAGVSLRGVDLAAAGADSVFAGVVVGLLVGKPVGITLASLLAIGIGLSTAPRGLDWRGISVVGLVAGIGFTMAIFIAGLALEDEMLSVAKLAILTASAAAGLFAFTFGRLALAVPTNQPTVTCDEAEKSTEH